MKRLTFLLSFINAVIISLSQEFNLPIKFVAEYEDDYYLGGETINSDLKEEMTVSFDGKTLICKWASGKIFTQKEISNYKILKLDDPKSIIYALETEADNGLIKYILIERQFETYAMVNIIKFPYMLKMG